MDIHVFLLLEKKHMVSLFLIYSFIDCLRRICPFSLTCCISTETRVFYFQTNISGFRSVVEKHLSLTVLIFKILLLSPTNRPLFYYFATMSNYLSTEVSCYIHPGLTILLEMSHLQDLEQDSNLLFIM